MTYLGNTPTTQSFIEGTDYFNGDGSTVAFTLSRTVVSPNDIIAVVNNVVQQPNTAYTISGTTITFTSAPSAGTSNIYVRYLSTTTQSITPSQNTVSYSTLNSDNQSKLGISFKNRFINGACTIDQRNAGASVSAVNGTYTLDRWGTFSFVSGAVTGKYTVQQSSSAPAGFSNSLLVTSSASTAVAAGNIFGLYQWIEGYNIADWNWGSINAKTITISFWVQSSLTGTFGGCLQNAASNRTYPFTYSINSANTWEQKSVTITGDQSGTWSTTNGGGVCVIFGLGVGSTYSGTAGTWASSSYYGATGATSVVSTSGATFYVTGVQLEVGTQATTFDYRSYGTELALCQRYFYKSIGGSGTGGYNPVGNGVVTGSTGGDIFCPVPVTMRATPTCAFTGSIYLYDATGTPSLTSIVSVYGGFSNIYMSVAATGGGLTAGRGMLVYTNNNSANTFSFTAEL